MGLSGDVTASSFCKAASSKTENLEDFAPEDRAKSLLHMISNDIGQLAYLYAKINDCKKVRLTCLDNYYAKNQKDEITKMFVKF